MSLILALFGGLITGFLLGSLGYSFLLLLM